MIYTIEKLLRGGKSLGKWKSFVTDSTKNISNDVIEVNFVWKLIIQNIFKNSQINYNFDDYFDSIIDVSNTKYGKASENCAVLTNKG